jgi:tetratricopeptide (TPR) repeat protein
LECSKDDASSEVRFNLLNLLGTFARFQGDYAAAQKAYEQHLAEARAVNDLWQIAEANSGLGSVAYQQGDFTTARKFIEEVLAVSRELDEKYGVAAALNSLGDIARTEGDNAAARPLFEESLMISRGLGTKQFVSAILANLGAVTFGEGDFAAARAHFTEALKTAQDLGNRTIISLSLDGFAALAAERGDAECAARLSGAAENLRESIGYEIEPADLSFRDSFLAKIRAALPEPDLSASFERGRKLKPEEAVALCLENNNGGDRTKALKFD